MKTLEIGGQVKMSKKLFTHSVVRPPSDAYAYCIKSGIGKIDVTKAKLQHKEFVDLLTTKMGIKVSKLMPLDLPDSVFIEDNALYLNGKVILTRPGAQTRRQEITTTADFFEEEGYKVDMLTQGTLDGGDVLQIGGYIFIGISERTTNDAAQELCKLTKWIGLTPHIVDVKNAIHLRTKCSALDPLTLFAIKGLQLPQLPGIRTIEIDDSGLNTANFVATDGKVLMCKGYPKTAELLNENGYEVFEVDLTEFEKGGGGPSSLCLRYTKEDK